MSTRNLTSHEQITEIRAEFYDEAVRVKANRSALERQMALNHINGLLDAYSVIKLELEPADGRGTE